MEHADAQLIIRTNELFHDLDAQQYEQRHPEIFVEEEARWKRLLDRFLLLPNDHPMTAVDLGTGTGFVGTMLVPRLRSGDAFICTDVSEAMLEVSKKNLEALSSGAAIRTHKLPGNDIDLPTGSADILTMNSVLHHVPDPAHCMSEAARVLRPGGLLFIGHEPNARFWRHPLLPLQRRVHRALSPRRLAGKLLRRGGKKNAYAPSAMLEQINRSLREEGLIDDDLDTSRLAQLVDAHSPTAGGKLRDEGFDPTTLLRGNAAMELLCIETYDYFPKHGRARSMALRSYERFMHLLFPMDGSIFFLVARKITQGVS